MTYKEFLNIVTFEEVAPHIVNMYPEAKETCSQTRTLP